MNVTNCDEYECDELWRKFENKNQIRNF